MLILVYCTFVRRAVPMNIDFVIHRSAEWTMLMLGDSILSILVVVVTKEGGDFFSVFYSSLLSVILLQLLYFQSQPHAADSHAVRRGKNSGILWNMLQHVYSLALVMLGGAFTFILLLSDEGRGRIRFLEGVNSTKSDAEVAACLFGGTLAVVFFSVDAMTVLHLGMEECQHRCGLKGQKNFKVIALVAMRIGIIGFTATLSYWVTKPKDLAIIGLCCVLAQLVLRKFGSICLPNTQKNTQAGKKDHEIADDSETGEARWPNVAHARAVSLDNFQE